MNVEESRLRESQELFLSFGIDFLSPTGRSKMRQIIGMSTEMAIIESEGDRQEGKSSGHVSQYPLSPRNKRDNRLSLEMVDQFTVNLDGVPEQEKENSMECISSLERVLDVILAARTWPIAAEIVKSRSRALSAQR
jgi:hypothetical protein